MLVVRRRALRMIAKEAPGDRGLAVVGGPDDQQVAGPDAAGLGVQEAPEQRDSLARPRVADPAIGGQARQALVCRQQGQITRLGAEMRHVHRLLTIAR